MQENTKAKARRRGSYKIVGRTSDGVAILAPKTKPEHFTSQEMRTTIRQLRSSQTGRFVEAAIGRDPNPPKR